ncbi:MAG: PLP-dependent aminotransferase family protein [Halopseudomonas aestusnigri]
MALQHVRLEGITLNSEGPGPLYRQLCDEIVSQITSGILGPGDILPPSRQLSKDLAIGRTTVIQAYDILKSNMHLESKPGIGTYVSFSKRDHKKAPPEKASHVADEHMGLSRYASNFKLFGCSPEPDTQMAFLPGMPDIESFPADLFGRYLSKYAKKSRPETSCYGYEGGWPKLKTELVRHLAISRGIKCHEDNVVIVTSAQSALNTLSLVLADPNDVALLENPFYPGAKMAMENAGLRIKPVEVDDNGADIETALEQHPNAKLIYLTPTSQYPLCKTLSLTRRKQLLKHAKKSGLWIMEDDYDSEFRFTKRPVASLKSMDDQGKVIYIGSFSKTLLPGFRVGYMVLPDSLSNVVKNVVWQTAIEPALPLQAAIADFMMDGHYNKHLRRMRQLYKKRHDLLVKQLGSSFPRNIPITPITGGMNLPVLLAPEYNDQAIVDLLSKENITARALSGYSFGDTVYNGLFLGFSCVNEADIKAGVSHILKAL